MNIEIRWGFDYGHRNSIAHILYESLGEKFRPVFGDQERGLSCVSTILQPDRVLMALNGDDVLGIAGLQFRGSGYLDTRLRTLVKHLGWRILKTIYNGWLLETKVKEGELYLDTIAVTKQSRGQGVGSRLLKNVIDFGSSEGFSCIKLSVIGPNIRAKELYERIGFKETQTNNIPYPWSRTFGFSSASDMELKLH